MNVQLVLTFFDVGIVKDQNDSKGVAFIGFLEKNEFISGCGHGRLGWPNKNSLLAFRGEAQKLMTKCFFWFVLFILKNNRPVACSSQGPCKLRTEIGKGATIPRVFRSQEQDVHA